MAFGVNIKMIMPNINLYTGDRRLMQKIGSEVVSEIKERTRRGFDVDKRKFEPYSPKTLAREEYKGRSRRVDLTFTGSMLRSITVTKVTDKEAFIGFTRGREEQKAMAHQFGERHLPIRKFFGLSKLARLRVMRKFGDEIRKRNRLR